jgi:transcriptional regulator EpsA
LDIESATNSDALIDSSTLDALVLEAFMLNVDASLRVHSHHRFFAWTQGLLQHLVRHRLLICAVVNAHTGSFDVECHSVSAADPVVFGDLLRRDPQTLSQLVRSWEENRFEPVTVQTRARSWLPGGALARALTRIEADIVLVHGTCDALGRVASLFAFACDSEWIGAKERYLAKLIVPFLHLAWMRPLVDRPAERPGTAWSDARILTDREREILKWIQVGKSNFEIGVILGISPLTVKNHVRRILRKLEARNRAQAVGKGMALGMLID